MDWGGESKGGRGRRKDIEPPPPHFLARDTDSLTQQSYVCQKMQLAEEEPLPDFCQSSHSLKRDRERGVKGKIGDREFAL